MWYDFASSYYFAGTILRVSSGSYNEPFSDEERVLGNEPVSDETIPSIGEERILGKKSSVYIT